MEDILAERPVVNRVVTPEEAVSIALRESPVLRGAAEEVEVALGRLNAARAERRPVVSANTFLSGGSIANIVESPEIPIARMIMNLPQGGYFDQNLMLMVPVYTAGRLRTLVRGAEAVRGAAQAQLEGQRQEVALLTRVAYREVQARRTLVEVQRARLRENEERLRVDRARLAQEQIPAFYVLRDEAEVAATQQELT
ncbi:MAG TPA: TolC family protein, partial [Chloroflexota bacterium]|nr:TolC family protein [Chloroflexota bacterium]